jgi:hypothetical protein
MVHETREEIQLSAIEPVSNAVKTKRPNAGIEKHFPPRPGSRIARLHRVQIFNKARSQSVTSFRVVPANLCSRRRNEKANGRFAAPERLAVLKRLGQLMTE